MLICALFGMHELDTSNFQTSELRALNIEYFRYVRGEVCDSSFKPTFYCVLILMILITATKMFKLDRTINMRALSIIKELILLFICVHKMLS